MSETRVLYVIPPYFNIDDYTGGHRSSTLPPFTVPYGVLSLDTFTRARVSPGIRVESEILDLNLTLREYLESHRQVDCLRLLVEQVSQRTREFRPHIVGISALFNVSMRYMEDLASAAKAVDPTITVVAGGGLPSAASALILDVCPSIEAVCKGEGELPLTDLINAADRPQLLEDHASWLTRGGVAKGKTPSFTFVWDLDELPMLNYYAINLDDYNSRSIDKRYVGVKKREMAIHTSRGCPFLCVFCSNPALHGRKVRTMSVERVIEEVRMMKEQHGLTVLLIEDDHFFANVERAKKILAGLAQFGIRIEFPNGVAVYAIDDEVGDLFARAGVSTVALAIESGSDYVLRHIIKKPLQKKMVGEKVKILRRHGVQSHAFIVIGLPGELDEHRDETMQLLLEVGLDWVHVFCAIPIVGSRLYDICVEKGYMERLDPVDHINTKASIRAPGVDPEVIEKFAYDMNLSLNFVNNYNLKAGNYATALKYFANVCDRYPDHAFGHYALSRTLRGSGEDPARADAALETFHKIIAEDPWWRAHAERHGLVEAPLTAAAS